MRDWQFNILFIVAILGALVMLFADPLGLDISSGAITIYAGLLAFVYQTRERGKDDDDDDTPTRGGARRKR